MNGTDTSIEHILMSSRPVLVFLIDIKAPLTSSGGKLNENSIPQILLS